MKPQASINLPDIHDPSKYVLVPNVAILDESNDDDLRLSFLKTLVAETNERIDRGDYVLLTIGHTDDEIAEVDQPPIVGYATNMQIGDKDKQTVIMADFHIMKDQYEEAMSFPRRSVELWHDKERTRGYVDIVSLLRRTPARSLGLLTMRNCGSRSIYCCPFIGEDMTITDQDLERMALAIADRLSKFEKSDEKEDEHPKDCDCKDCLEADEDLKDGLENEEDDEDKKTENDAVASGSDTFVPGEIEEKKATKMRADSSRITLSRLEKRLSDVEAERDLLVMKLRRSERETHLKQLEAEGFQFDIVEELAHVETLDDSKYALHLDRARRLYRRYPIGAVQIRTAEPEIGNSKELTNEVVRFASKKGITDFGVALDRYNKEKV